VTGATFRRFLFLVLLLFTLPTSTTLLIGQMMPAATSPDKTAAEAFHNVQVLKNIPADELIPAMQFITYSLGVECSYCHVEGAMEKDDKKNKLAARKMMEMMAAINRENFDFKQVVTCYSCHRGSPRPVAVPAIVESANDAVGISPTEGERAAANTPTPDEIIAKYVNAMGGAATLAKIKTRKETGTINISGRSLPLEVLSSTGGKQLNLIHLPNGDSVTAYNGTSGWTSAPNRPVHSIPAAEVTSARSETDLQLPLHLKELFDELKSVLPEKIADREIYVVAGLNSGDVAAKFYFDQDSGYLLRILRYTTSPLGKNPTQTDYQDYREQDNIKVPFRCTISRPNSRVTVQIKEVKFNLPIDDARFAQPAAAVVPK